MAASWPRAPSKNPAPPYPLRSLTGIGKAGGMLVIGGRGDRQFTADRLDTQALAMGVYERNHRLPWRSSSAIAKYAEALRRISLARRSSLTVTVRPRSCCRVDAPSR
jgi:hypothetical protein